MLLTEKNDATKTREFQHLGQQKAANFDQQVRTLLLQFHKDGMLPLQVVGTVTWGTPERGIAR
jgi:hypothetical protein